MGRIDRVAVFCSYAHADEKLRNELFKHVELLRRSGLLTVWHDGEIRAGSDWLAEIEAHLRTADIILLLVSVDLLSSTFVTSVELPVALARHQSGEALVIPVVLRPVAWEWSGLAELQALPDGLRPVVEWTSRDQAWVSVCEGLVKAVLLWGGDTGTSRPAVLKTASGSITRQRAMDVGLPRQVPIGLSTVLAVMVRRKDSQGLAGLFDLEASYGLTPSDLKSSGAFAVCFTKAVDGTVQPAELSVRIETADFGCASREKPLNVPPRGDSDVCVFLLNPLRAGPLRVNVEIWSGSKRLAGCLVAATASAGVGFEPAVQTSVGLDFVPPRRFTSMGWYKAAGAAALSLILVSGASVLLPLLRGPLSRQLPEIAEPASGLPQRAEQTTPRPPRIETPATATAAPVQRLRHELVQLNARADSVRTGMRALRARLKAEGATLRPDIVASESAMNRYLTEAAKALRARDTAAAERDLRLAHREISLLEEFLAR